MKQWTPKEKIDHGRMLLAREYPFFASVFYRMNIVEDDTCETAWTDGTSVGYNPVWLGQWTIEQIAGVFVHEVLHVVGKHFLRKTNSINNNDKWNRACDYALNPMVHNTPGLDLPPGVLLDMDKWPDELAEYIYEQLPDNPPNSGTGWDIGEVRPYKDGKATEAEKSTKAHEVDTWVNAAGMKAQSAGSIGANEKRLLKDVHEPAVLWQDELNMTVESICKNNYTWTRPNTRYIQSGVYLPSMKGVKVVDMIFFVDTSGSLIDRQLEQIVSEVRVVISGFDIRAVVVYWDTKFRGVEIFDKSDVLDPDWKLDTRGGGGTDFSGVLDWMENEANDFDVDPRAAIFFTDLECTKYPDADPGMPWIWAHVPGRSGFNTRYIMYKPNWGTYVKVPIFQKN